jgi:hypothetical protein
VGKPDNPDDYLAIELGEWARRYGTIYVPWEMWNSLRPVSRALVFYIQEHGRFCLDFDVPIGRRKVSH